MNDDYTDLEPTRAAIDALAGASLLEFGNPFCGHCRRAQPLLAEAMVACGGLRHIKIADGRGRRLGRSFGVKLWPTLVFVRDGVELGRLVRPQDAAVICQGLSVLVEQAHLDERTAKSEWCKPA